MRINRVTATLVLGAMTAMSLSSLVEMASAASRSARKPANCRAFLTGDWSGSGTVTGFGPPAQVKSSVRYNKDGTFRSSTAYLGSDKRWTEQAMVGTWSAITGDTATNCTVALKSVSPNGESSSTSEISMIDGNTYRSFGVDFKRITNQS